MLPQGRATWSSERGASTGMTTHLARVALTLLAASTFVCCAANAQPAEPATPPKDPEAAVILFIDRGAVLKRSIVGMDLSRQAEALSKEIESDLKAEREQIEADVDAYNAKLEPMTPAAHLAQLQSLQDRGQILNKKIKDRQAAIDTAVADGRVEIEKSLAPILEQILSERRANLLLDRNLVVLGATTLDITKETIARLNGRLTSVTLTLRSAKAAGAQEMEPPE